MQKFVQLLYRHPDGGEFHWTVPVPCSPDLLRTIDAALARKGYVRAEEPD